MTPTKAEELLTEAREIFASDPDRALALRREVAASAVVSPAWSNAHIDLASHELSVGNYQAAADHAAAVLAAPPTDVEPAARAVAGIVLADAREALGLDVDEALLAASIEAAFSSRTLSWAGAGLKLLAGLHNTRGDRGASKQLLERAVSAYDQTDSALAAPGALLRLATMEHEDGNVDRARELIAEALLRLDKHPFIGRGAHVLREKLEKLSASMK